MQSNLRSLYPSIYRDVSETDALSDIGDAQFNQYFTEMDNARKNQFALTAGKHGITMLERIYQIKANPAIEELEFRRQRLLGRMQLKVPFTFCFLLQRLDEVVGAGKYRAWLSRGHWNSMLGSWRLGRTPFRDQPYTLYVSTVADNVGWYEEIQVFVNTMKPANLIFTINPYLAHGIAISEQIEAQLIRHNYVLGGWRLEGKAFRTNHAKEVVKVPQNASITSDTLADHAQLTASLIASVRLNGVVQPEQLQIYVSDRIATVRYFVTPNLGLTEITLIELLDAENCVKSASHVFIPVPKASQIVLEHSISHEEMK